jgi:hypothetical protein
MVKEKCLSGEFHLLKWGKNHRPHCSLLSAYLFVHQYLFSLEVDFMQTNFRPTQVHSIPIYINELALSIFL